MQIICKGSISNAEKPVAINENKNALDKLNMGNKSPPLLDRKKETLPQF